MPTPLINLLLAASNDKERTSYLCELSDKHFNVINNLKEIDNQNVNEDTVIICCESNYKTISTEIENQGIKNKFLILIAEDYQKLFPSEDHLNNFFDKGGLTIFQKNWKDLAFKRLLHELEKTNGHLNNLEVEHSALITFYLGVKTVKGYTKYLGKNRASSIVFEEINADQADFSIQLTSTLSAHGKCKITNNTPNEKMHTHNISMEIIEFHGISRIILNKFVSDSLSMQAIQQTGTQSSNKEYLNFVKQTSEPLTNRYNTELIVVPSHFANGSELSKTPWLPSVLLRWLKALLEYNSPKIFSTVTLFLKENYSGNLCLFVTVPILNQIEFDTTNDTIIAKKTFLGQLVTSNDLDILVGQGLMIEQYPTEEFEHLAIILEIK